MRGIESSLAFRVNPIVATVCVSLFFADQVGSVAVVALYITSF